MGHELHRQVGLVEHLVTAERGEGNLGRGDGPQVVSFQVVGVVDELREVPGRYHRLRLDQAGRAHLPVGVGVAVQAVLDERPAQGGPLPGVHHEHGPGELGTSFHVQDAQFLADLPVGDPLVVPVGILIPVFVADDHVVGLARPVRTVVVGDVGDPQQDLPDLVGQPIGLRGQSLLLLPQFPAPGLQVGRLVGPTVPVEAADLPGDGVYLVTQAVSFLGQGPLAGIQLHCPVQPGGVLAPAGDGRLDGVGVAA